MNQTTTKPSLQQLTEHLSDWHSDDVQIDADQRIVRNVALTGRNSKNGYHYSEAALRGAVVLYESKPVFLDHATNRTRPYDRSTRDLVGSVVNARFEDDRIRGDIQTLDTEAGRTFIALAKTSSPAVGMSHVVLAERSKDRTVVEKIHEVVSVDAVVFPATTATFSENITPNKTSSDNQHPIPLPGTAEAILQEIDLQLPGHLHRLTGDTSTIARRVGLFSDRLIVELQNQITGDSDYHEIQWNIVDHQVTLSEEMEQVDIESLPTATETANLFTNDKQHSKTRRKLKQLTAERNGLLKRIEKIVQEQHRKQRTKEVEQLLEKSSLPESAIDDHFRQQLIETTNTKKRFKLIEDRRQLVQMLSSSSPHSWERKENHNQPSSDESFINTLRGTTNKVQN